MSECAHLAVRSSFATKISTGNAPGPSSTMRCSKTLRGSASAGRRGRTSAVPLGPIPRASAASTISMPGALCSTPDSSIPAAAPVKTWHGPSARRRATTTKARSIRERAGQRRAEARQEYADPAGTNWRFRVPDGEGIEFADHHFGRQRFTAGTDFGDFLVWRRDDVPSYQLACVVDDIAMRITEVVRGADLLRSTARQILLYRALGAKPPEWYHCPLITDARRAASRQAPRCSGNPRAAGTGQAARGHPADVPINAVFRHIIRNPTNCQVN